MSKMPTTLKFLIVCFILFLTAYFSWNHYFPSGTWRYKMTVAVETPEGIKTGSAVREVSVHMEPRIIPEQGGGYAHLTKGEAVIVDLGSRGVLFALMKNQGSVDYGHKVFFDAFPAPNCGNGCISRETILYFKSIINSGQKVILKLEQYPMFVRFRDMNDPKTVESVGFDGAFGQGVSLKYVTIEMTKDPVTLGKIEHYLPWLQKTKGYIDGRFAGGYGGLANALDKGDFQRE